MKLKPLPQPNDTNLLEFMFMLARNDTLLNMFLQEIKFIRANPTITIEQVRREHKRIQSTSVKLQEPR